MRTFKEILKEVHEQASKDNCQSWDAICLLAMEQAVNETTEDIVGKLEQLSNCYEIHNGIDIIRKQDLDAFTLKLESELP